MFVVERVLPKITAAIALSCASPLVAADNVCIDQDRTILERELLNGVVASIETYEKKPLEIPDSLYLETLNRVQKCAASYSVEKKKLIFLYETSRVREDIVRAISPVSVLEIELYQNEINKAKNFQRYRSIYQELLIPTLVAHSIDETKLRAAFGSRTIGAEDEGFLGQLMLDSKVSDPIENSHFFGMLSGAVETQRMAKHLLELTEKD